MNPYRNPSHPALEAEHPNFELIELDFTQRMRVRSVEVEQDIRGRKTIRVWANAWEVPEHGGSSDYAVSMRFPFSEERSTRLIKAVGRRFSVTMAEENRAAVKPVSVPPPADPEDLQG